MTTSKLSRLSRKNPSSPVFAVTGSKPSPLSPLAIARTVLASSSINKALTPDTVKLPHHRAKDGDSEENFRSARDRAGREKMNHPNHVFSPRNRLLHGSAAAGGRNNLRSMSLDCRDRRRRGGWEKSSILPRKRSGQNGDSLINTSRLFRPSLCSRRVCSRLCRWHRSSLPILFHSCR